MQIERKKISELNRAAYNPRIDLIPGDTEYENLRRSITTYGMLIPVVWNKRTGNVVGGHQRLTVLENEGETEVDVSVVDLDEMQERQLNVALNKIEGGWDEEKLAELLTELGDDATLTGFTQQEIDSLTNDIDGLIDGDTVDEELRAIEELFNVSLTFDKADQEELKAYVKDYGKEALIETIIQKAKGEIYWGANVAHRLFCAISRCALIPIRGAATGVNTASRRRSRTLRRYSATKPWRPCVHSSREREDARRRGATGIFLFTGAA